MTAVLEERNLPSTRLSRVAVTGATGFIGARLVELLAQDDEFAGIVALAHRRDGERPTRCIRFDNRAAVAAALTGCKAVVHCAFDFHDLAVNLRIAEILADVCEAGKIRLVQMSSAAVYEPLPDGDLDERFPIQPTDSYKAAKTAIENELIRRSRESGLDTVILQPTIVYGPAGRAWTDSPIRDLLDGAVALPEEGTGLCNAVFVDDVCRAAINAVKADIPPGERFLITGPAPVEWRQFLGAYQQMIGGDSLRFLPKMQVRHAASSAPLMTPAAGNAMLLKRGGMEYLKAAVLSRLSADARARLNMAFRRLRSLTGRNSIQLPTGAKLALYSGHCRIRSDKARIFLHYEPKFDLERGMEITGAYVRRAYSAQIARRATKGSSS